MSMDCKKGNWLAVGCYINPEEKYLDIPVKTFSVFPLWNFVKERALTKKHFRYLGYEALCFECLEAKGMQDEKIKNVHVSLAMMCQTGGIGILKSKFDIDKNFEDPSVDEDFSEPEEDEE